MVPGSGPLAAGAAACGTGCAAAFAGSRNRRRRRTLGRHHERGLGGLRGGFDAEDRRRRRGRPRRGSGDRRRAHRRERRRRLDFRRRGCGRLQRLEARGQRAGRDPPLRLLQDGEQEQHRRVKHERNRHRQREQAEFTVFYFCVPSARQTFSGVIGISRCCTPRSASASSTACTTAGTAPMVPSSPHALDAEQVGLAGHALVEGAFHRRQLVGARHAVVHQRAGQQLAALGVVDHAARRAPGRCPAPCRRGSAPRRSCG